MNSRSVAAGLLAGFLATGSGCGKPRTVENNAPSAPVETVDKLKLPPLSPKVIDAGKKIEASDLYGELPRIPNEKLQIQDDVLKLRIELPAKEIEKLDVLKTEELKARFDELLIDAKARMKVSEPSMKKGDRIIFIGDIMAKLEEDAYASRHCFPVDYDKGLALTFTRFSREKTPLPTDYSLSQSIFVRKKDGSVWHGEALAEPFTGVDGDTLMSSKCCARTRDTRQSLKIGIVMLNMILKDGEK